jgi:hypothetical protein
MSCGCEGESILVTTVGGVPGPAGPEGPQGPPGAGIDLPLPASDVSVTNAGFANLQEVIDYLLYVPTVIQAFNIAVSTYEIGSSVSALNFSWTLNQNPLSQALSGPNLTPPALAITARSSAVTLTAALNPATVGTSYSYQLSVTDSLNTVQSTKAVTFLNGIYYGDAAIPGAVNSAFVTSLAKVLQSSRSRSYTTSAGPGVYAWFAHRSALGTATFTVGGFAGGFEAPVVVSVTNASGFTENYNVYRSTNPNIGPVGVVVS